MRFYKGQYLLRSHGRERVASVYPPPNGIFYFKLMQWLKVN